MILKRDGGVSNFDVQGTLALQILNQEDGHFQVQVLRVCVCVHACVHFLSILLLLFFFDK